MSKGLIVFLFIFSSHATAGVEDIFDGQTSIESPFKLRDPFLPSSLKEKRTNPIKGVFDGKFTNINKIKDSFDPATVNIVGVLIGKDRRVLINLAKGGEVFTLREGDRFGSRDMKIKAILPGGIILAEKISNIYGESEYIETIIPISK